MPPQSQLDLSKFSPEQQASIRQQLETALRAGSLNPAQRSSIENALKSFTTPPPPGTPEVGKPTLEMEQGGGAMGAAGTSFLTQLANLPRNLWESSFFGEIGNPRVKAEHEARIKAMEAPGIEGVKNTFQAANPVVSDESGVDIGATAANLLPYLLAVRGFQGSRLARAAGTTALEMAKDTPILRKLGKFGENYRATAPGYQPDIREATLEAVKEGRAAKIPVRIPEEKPAAAPRKTTPPPVRYSTTRTVEEAGPRKATIPPLKNFKGPADVAAAQAAEQGIEGSLPKGRGRMVLTPEEIQKLKHFYELNKRAAHERGMAFAGGRIPAEGRSVPRAPLPQSTLEWRGLRGAEAQAAMEDILRRLGEIK